jgi:hypothetical protein
VKGLSSVFVHRNDLKQYFSQLMREKWQDAEYRESLLNKRQMTWQDPEYKARVTAERKSRWENEEYREKSANAIKQAWSNPELKAQRSEESKSRWENEEFRNQSIQAFKEARRLERGYDVRVIKPDGTEFVVSCLADFAREQGVGFSTCKKWMNKGYISKGERKGWRFEKIPIPKTD